MSGSARTPARESAKAPAKSERARSPFRERAFAEPAKNMETETEERTAAGLIQTYLQRRRATTPAGDASVAGGVIQRHHNLPLDNPKEAKAHIYYVRQKKDEKLVYVGQTCDQIGVDERFKQHLKSGYHDNWSSDTHYIKAIWTSVMTQFETTTSEQYYIEINGGISKLENDVNALTASTFDKYVNDEGNPRWGKKWRPKMS